MPAEPLTNIAIRDMLIEHLDGSPVTLRTTINKKTDPMGDLISLRQRRRLVGYLQVRGYLVARVCANGVGMETVITQKGRAALASALADWADALVRAADPTAPAEAFPTALWGNFSGCIK